jgi:predicted NBD/HSP70 family sugar kinase
MTLNPDGAFSFGLKIGRRTSDIVLSDISGKTRGRRSISYRFPAPDEIMSFLKTAMAETSRELPEGGAARIAGIGIATPFQLWDWHDVLGARAADLAVWADFDFSQTIARFSDLPVWVENDATAACRAEHVFGRGRERMDYAYFFIGSFIGGGVVLNHSVYAGHQGNAGAFGSLPLGSSASLIDLASIYLLEVALNAAGKGTETLWGPSQDWSGYEPELSDWLARTSNASARAVVAVCSVIDFETVVIDGAFPVEVR